MKKKHAYLILAHNEFPILRKLITLLDDNRNDIFIHFDKKVNNLPELFVNNARLFVLENRVDVRWADVSVVEAELNLFENAFHKNAYQYFHLLSGVDMPIKSQDEIHQFFDKHDGKEFIGYYQQDNKIEIKRKVKRFHIFPKSFRKNNGLINISKKLFRSLHLVLQEKLNIERNSGTNFKKGTQWVSLTSDFVELIIKKRKEIEKMYSNTFCPDEIFIQTFCWNSDFRGNIYNKQDEGLGCMRYIQWVDNQIIDWRSDDFDKLVSSPYLFARKFSSKDLNIVNLLVNHFSVNQ
ncbi:MULTISPECIES: beta-1,6-N-acetylglucosaminyltransferase [Sphingobacterium]|uniref:Peptide O-xylosyltransferase n=1 Tax=Sphingobacterium tenebrionis TaxID=3111775 RepID=A0ABU8I6Y6_9SPHI|nr:beta-1,6-N-acetylglucosaminyltransferase [Sphingobacterium sp. CZ-2]QBR11235.1 glycosyl transferase [Sphingobacterium sp. CZ-2]